MNTRIPTGYNAFRLPRHGTFAEPQWGHWIAFILVCLRVDPFSFGERPFEDIRPATSRNFRFHDGVVSPGVRKRFVVRSRAGNPTCFDVVTLSQQPRPGVVPWRRLSAALESEGPPAQIAQGIGSASGGSSPRLIDRTSGEAQSQNQQETERFHSILRVAPGITKPSAGRWGNYHRPSHSVWPHCRQRRCRAAFRQCVAWNHGR